jgi:hypothetical protein
MLTQLALLFLGFFFLIAGIVAAIGVKRLLLAAVAAPFVAIAAGVATIVLWLLR